MARRLHIRNLFLVPFLFLMGGLAKGVPEQGQKVQIQEVTPEGAGPSIGFVELSDTSAGLKITPHLKGLTPGDHGFHIHENPSCAPSEKDGERVPAGQAGGHYDPEKTGKHLGPYGKGHWGDLPRLHVDEKGEATLPVTAPRLTLKDIQNRSLMVHAGGDNYSDTPAMGGGGARIACGVIEDAK